MKREFLKEFGLEEEVINKIMAENGHDIEKVKASSKELEDKLSILENQIKEKDTKIDELAKVQGNAETLKTKISELQEANKQQQQALKQSMIDSAVEMALVTSKAKNNKAVKSLLDIANAELVDGKIKGLDDQINKLKESDSYLFDIETAPKFKGANPNESGDPKIDKPLDKMNYAELCEYMAANPDAKLN